MKIETGVIRFYLDRNLETLRGVELKICEKLTLVTIARNDRFLPNFSGRLRADEVCPEIIEKDA